MTRWIKDETLLASLTEGNDMTDVFLSYARLDTKEVEPLVRALEQRGLSVWWDPAIVAGEVWDDSIQTALHAAGVVVVVWSRDSVSRPWVRAEAGDALERGVLVPVLLDDVEIPLRFRQVQGAVLTDWDGASDDPRLDQLAAAIRRKLEGMGPRPARLASDGPVNIPRSKSLPPRRGVPVVWVAAAAGFAVTGALLGRLWSNGADGGVVGKDPPAQPVTSESKGGGRNPGPPGSEGAVRGESHDAQPVANDIVVVKARIGCLDIQTAGNLTAIVGRACDGQTRCDYKAPTERAYRAAGVSAATRTFCTQAMEITYRCGTATTRVVSVPGDAWNHPPARLRCP